MYLSENIEYLRIKNGYSQDYIADKLGYKSFTTIQKWESGVSEPPIKILKKLSDLFGETMDDLVNVRLSNPEYNINVTDALSISDKEKELLIAFRKADEFDKAIVLRTLKLDQSLTEAAVGANDKLA